MPKQNEAQHASRTNVAAIVEKAVLAAIASNGDVASRSEIRDVLADEFNDDGATSDAIDARDVSNALARLVARRVLVVSNEASADPLYETNDAADADAIASPSCVCGAALRAPMLDVHDAQRAVCVTCSKLPSFCACEPIAPPTIGAELSSHARRVLAAFDVDAEYGDATTRADMLKRTALDAPSVVAALVELLRTRYVVRVDVASYVLNGADDSPLLVAPTPTPSRTPLGTPRARREHDSDALELRCARECADVLTNALDVASDDESTAREANAAYAAAASIAELIADVLAHRYADARERVVALASLVEPYDGASYAALLDDAAPSLRSTLGVASDDADAAARRFLNVLDEAHAPNDR